MAISPRIAADRIETTDTAWETHRKDKSFAGISIEQFRAITAPCTTARATLARLESERVTAREQRIDADKKAMETIRLIVNAVKGDTQEGEDGEFYTALGYVRKSERKSGLQRKGKAQATTKQS